MNAIIQRTERQNIGSGGAPTLARAPQSTAGQSIAAGLDEVAGMFNEMQDEVDTADAKNADVAFNEQLNDLLYNDETGYMYARGGDAMARREKIGTDLKALHKSSLAGLSPAARRKAESALTSRMQSADLRINQHAATERRGYLNSASEARITSSVQNAVFAPENITSELGVAMQEVRDIAAREGWAPEVLAVKEAEVRDQVYGGVINRMSKVDPIKAMEYLTENRDKLTGAALVRMEQTLVPMAKEFRGRQFARGLFSGGKVSLGTRAVNRPGAGGKTNISMDFNASTNTGARGTEVVIPDDASPEMRRAAEDFNARVVAFAAKHGIAQPNRGVRTRSENGRGVRNTVHTEPFFNKNIKLQKAVAENMDEFAQIYRDAFGHLPDVLIVPPHGIGKDRGAASEVFGDETTFGERVAKSLLSGDPDEFDEVEAMAKILAITDLTERKGAMAEFDAILGVNKARAAQAQAETSKEIMELIEKGGSVDDLDVETRTALAGDVLDEARSYEKKKRSSEVIETDSQFFVDLSQMVTDDPAGFMAANPMEWRNQLDDTDFERFVSLQSQMKTEGPTKSAAPSVATMLSTSDAALRAAGITKTGKGSKPEVYAQFQAEITRWSSANPIDASDPVKLQARINSMLVPVVINPPGVIRGKDTQEGLAFQIDFDGKQYDPDDDLTMDDLLDGSVTVNDIDVGPETMGMLAQLYLDKTGRDPSPQELLQAIIESGLYE